jgi:hypothetical protein
MRKIMFVKLQVPDCMMLQRKMLWRCGIGTKKVTLLNGSRNFGQKKNLLMKYSKVPRHAERREVEGDEGTKEQRF